MVVGCPPVSSHSLPLPARVTVTEFSPFQWSSNLLALGFHSSLSLIQVTFPEEDPSVNDASLVTLKDIHHDTRVVAAAWSPTTNITTAPKVLEVATAGTDHKLRIYNSDCGSELTVRSLEGHSDYINTIVFSPETGEQVVTGSDDHSIIVWHVASGEQAARLHFRSPVMGVAWHQGDSGKLAVGEKGGLVSLLNATSLAPILSLSCGAAPLMSLSWSMANSLLLSCAVASDVLVWDLSRPSLPSLRKSGLHVEGVRHVRCSNLSDSLIASCGRPGNSLAVSHSKSSQVLVSLGGKVAQGGLSWHARLPYLAVGGDRELQFHKVIY